ncbi:hypothetical protein [Streptomyces sp. NPDC006510]|uniref:hypothetical protein n=1 Tax=Streptomyces sp. NPDC006510 TaxID=3155600 RepID=UPI0033B62B42
MSGVSQLLRGDVRHARGIPTDRLRPIGRGDAYASGFLVIAVRSRPTAASAERAAPHQHDRLARLHHLDSYDVGSEVVIAGLEQRFKGRRAGREPR